VLSPRSALDCDPLIFLYLLNSWDYGCELSCLAPCGIFNSGRKLGNKLVSKTPDVRKLLNTSSDNNIPCFVLI
jgi:hypothetical protein